MPFVLNTQTQFTYPHKWLFSKKMAIVLGVLCALILLTSCSDNSSNSSNPPLATGNSTVTPQSEAMETLQVLSAPKGLNTKRLFIEPVSSPDARFNRLEREVQDLRDDFDLVSPAITRLVAVEQDMRDLMGQLETLVASESQPSEIVVQNVGVPVVTPPVTTTTQPILTTAPTPVTQPIPTSAIPANAIAVKNLRIGEHTDKTRMVLDMTGEAPYTVTLNADGKGMVMTFPKTVWQADAAWTSNVAPLIRSYKASPTADGGTRLDVSFVESASLKYKGYIEPRNGLSRLVIDLFSSDLHLAK